jgi:hypothetical protein
MRLLSILVAVVAASPPDGGAKHYEISPCSVMGTFPDGGGGGLVCDEARPGGWDSQWIRPDGSRERTVYRRTPDGGLLVETHCSAADGGPC